MQNGFQLEATIHEIKRQRRKLVPRRDSFTSTALKCVYIYLNSDKYLTQKKLTTKRSLLKFNKLLQL